MASESKRQLAEQVAALTAAVAELRLQLATRHGCTCAHWHYWPAPYVQPPYVQPTIIWSSGSTYTSTAIGGGSGGAG